MKQLFTSLMVVFSLAAFATENTKTITVDNVERSFIYYTPESYDNTKGYNTLMLLHPIGTSASEFSENCRPQTIADANDCIVVFPQALDEQNSEVKTAISSLENYGVTASDIAFLKTQYVWGAGVRLDLNYILQYIPTQYQSFIPMVLPGISKKGYLELNQDVDDVKYLNAVFDYMKDSVAADGTNYIAGASIGGAMTYKYIYSEESQASKAAIIHGFVSVGTDTTGIALNIPVCVFHSQSDSIAKYNGGIFNGSIPETVESIANANGCKPATTDSLDDWQNDSMRVVRKVYENADQNTVYFYIVDNASHFDFLTKEKNDIDYITEMEEFFFYKDKTGVATVANTKNTVYPNPVENELYTSEVGNYQIIDLSGKTVQQGVTTGNAINVSNLAKGSYLLKQAKNTTVILKK